MTGQSRPPARPPGWQAEHARRYIETNGEDGHIWEGVPTLLLTTTGRRSGKTYTTPLIYGEHDGRYLVVASRGGADQHPQWYRNLLAHPEVAVQVKAERFRARARTASPEEKSALWRRMAHLAGLRRVSGGTSRDISVVILERI